MKLQDCNSQPQPHIDFRASVHDTDGFAFSPRPCGPCWWSQRPAGWTWTCWESHCAWSCQWPGYICRWKQVEQRWKGSQIITWAWATAPTCCARQEVQEDGLTWWFLPWCVCTDLQTDFWRCCFVAAKQRDIYCYFTTRGPPCTWNLQKNYSAAPINASTSLWCFMICNFHPASPSLVSQRPQHSGGSPVGRCHCIGARVQSERWSAQMSISLSLTFILYSILLYIKSYLFDFWLNSWNRKVNEAHYIRKCLIFSGTLPITTLTYIQLYIKAAFT